MRDTEVVCPLDYCQGRILNVKVNRWWLRGRARRRDVDR